MNQIVDWEEIVGAEFMDRFVKIATAIVYAKQRDILHFEDTVRASVKADDWQTYSQKRALMRKAGYYEDRGFLRWSGWFIPYLESKKLRFLTTAPPGREIVPLRRFLDFKRGLDQASLEDEYYGGDHDEEEGEAWEA
jgi:hypothetical protein